MKKHLVVLFMLIFCLKTYSQIVFENGYFIDENDQRVECLIKNIEWQYNPAEFVYKLSETSDIQIASIHSVKEFGIKNVSKYVRAKVNIDRSSEDLAKLTSNRCPAFQEETLFLKVLIEGKATLFIYEERGLKRFFYQTANSEINQLVHKSFLIDNNKIGYNNQYRQQLRNDLQCQDINFNDINKLEFFKNELVRFFIKYNNCQNASYINYGAKNWKDRVNLTVRPGVKHSSLSLDNNTFSFASEHIEFESSVSFRLGGEIEFFLPFNKNKWAVIIEPTYQDFKSQKVYNSQKIDVKYKSIELAFGVRHYFHFNERSKIFINSSFIWDLTTNSTIEYDTGRILEISTFYNYAAGLGYNYYNKYSIELRYHTIRNILVRYPYWNSEYKTISMVLGYSFF